MDFAIALKGHELTYDDELHAYYVDGIIVPSITQLLKLKFGKKYEGVSTGVMRRAAERGTEMHTKVELFCRFGLDDGSEEVRNFKFLMKQYGMTVKANEIPVILFDKGSPFAAGRLDLVLEKDDNLGLGDLKRTATLDKEYLAYQLNIYRRAYQQCYDSSIEFLCGIHLREDKRKLVALPIQEKLVDEMINNWKEKTNEFSSDERQAD